MINNMTRARDYYEYIFANTKHYSDVTVYDTKDNSLIYMSSSVINSEYSNFKKEMKKQQTVYLKQANRTITTKGLKYNMFKSTNAASSYAHSIVSAKSSYEESMDGDGVATGNSILVDYIYCMEAGTAIDKVFDMLLKFSPVPIRKEWASYIFEELVNASKIREMRVSSIYEDYPLKVYKIVASKTRLQSIITEGIQDGVISIAENTNNSDFIDTIEGLDDYLNLFGDTLANKVQDSFAPKFNPETGVYGLPNQYYDDYCYYNGIDLYPAQRSVIESASIHLEKSNTTLVVAEMGSGKTLMGAGIAYSNFKRKAGMTCVVMCPGHLLTTWKKEVEKVVPNGTAYIVRDLDQLQEIEYKMKNKYKQENMFVIMSKDVAKSSYHSCPAVKYSISNKAFVCPDCGRPLTKRIKVGVGRARTTKFVPLDDFDFTSEIILNSKCGYTAYDEKGNEFIDSCGAKLWRPLNKFENTRDWFKFGKAGWIYKTHAETIYNDLLNSHALNANDRELVQKMSETIDNIGTEDENKGLVAPRKYSIATYIRRKLKGTIDYFIVDECHLYQNSPKKSLQTKAMIDILKSSNKSILLTGTLLNGFASGLYYILYNTIPKEMRKEGFDYSSEMDFVRKYGVVEKKSRYTKKDEYDTRLTKSSGTQENQKPGVSPLVFTKFLLENTVFLSLADMSEGLPNYEEIPIFVDMDEELKTAYETVDETMRSLVSSNKESGGKLLGSLLQLLSVYPDTPYGQSPILDPDNGDVLYTPESIPKGLRNKEHAAIALIKEKVANGEKVLLYNNWTKKTDVADKLYKALKEEGINVRIMTSEGKNKVEIEKRAEWIDEQVEKGLEVLICNPKLVETGLNLLAFTNILFYQVGYSIFTLRQASRRSYRLSQTKDVKVYFMSYKDTIQSAALSLMATKLHAALAIESNFSEEGLRALSDNEDILTKIAASVINGMEGLEDSIKTVKVMASKRTDKLDRERHPMEEIEIKKNVDFSLDYLDAHYKNKLNKKDKLLKRILESSFHIGNLY